MTRFRAYASDSDSSDDDDDGPPTSPLQTKAATPIGEPSEHESAEEDGILSEHRASGSESSSSEMDEDDSSTTTRTSSVSRKRNALVEDEDGEIRYVHEVDGLPAHMDVDALTIPRAQQLGIDVQKMNVMQTSLFRMPEEASALKVLQQGKTSWKRLDLAPPPRPQPRKHGRESDVDVSRLEFQERNSFAHEVGPLTYRPSRKYARVDKTSSITNDCEASYVDAGLALGRSFRVSWGPGGILAHLGHICSPNSTSLSANSSVLHLTNTSALLTSNSVNNKGVTSSVADSTVILSSKLLQHHLINTEVVPDSSGIPMASPKLLLSPSVPPDSNLTSSYKYLDFASFASLFPYTDQSSPAMLFRLGASLFDPIDLHLGSQYSSPSIMSSSPIAPDINTRVALLRRKSSLGIWLADAVKSSVEVDLRNKASGHIFGDVYTTADAAFIHLTGHQVEKACFAAADGGYPKLSTLISQIDGDELFKDDIREQLRVWKSENLGPSTGTGFSSGLVGRGVWKVYCLLGGILDDEGELADKLANVCLGLDWKRIFGLCLWYGQGLEAPISKVVEAYERLVFRQSNLVSSSFINNSNKAKPLPPWLLDVQRKGYPAALFTKWNNMMASANPAAEPNDPLYALIKLHADPALSLSSILNPFSFSSSLMEAGIPMCWHLYIILSRVMRARDFADRRPAIRPRRSFINGGGREEGSEDEDGYEKLTHEGHSPTADLLTSAYAFQLESWGMIQEAIFVLLHIEHSTGREKAVKELLARSAPRLDEWMVRGIAGSMKIPTAWIDEAKAHYALYKGDQFSAYEMFLSAGFYDAAHRIAVLDLAPGIILEGDLNVIKELFEVFDSETRHDQIDGWFVRGKVLLDYAHILTRLPELQDQIDDDDDDDDQDRPVISDVVIAQEIDDLIRRVPKIIEALPDIFDRSWSTDRRHVAVTEKMIKGLLAVTERVKPAALTQIQQSTLTVVDGAARIELISSLGLARFIRDIEG